MIKLLRKKKEPGAHPLPYAIDPAISNKSGTEFLVEVVKRIRPVDPANFRRAELKFRSLLSQMTESPSFLYSFRKTILSQFINRNMIPALTESGIMSSRGFFQEFSSKLKHKILPALQQPDDILYVISHVFYVKTDYIWVEGIDRGLWKKFFENLGIRVNLTEPGLIRQFQRSLLILSYRVSSIGLEKELTQRSMYSEDALTPFLEQNRLVLSYLESCGGIPASREGRMSLRDLMDVLHQCRESINQVKERGIEEGTSLAQTYLMIRLEELIERMFIVIDVLDNDLQFDTDRFIEYFHTIVRNENRKNSVREFLLKNLGLVAYQIAEHKGKKGEKYISGSKPGYWLLFTSSMGGGLIVSFVAIIKNLITNVHLPLFWQGMSYGTNYAAGFVVMDMTHTTLATKQPAYTASAIAASLDTQKLPGRPDLYNLAITIAKTSRSQIASFAGNLLVVFPFTYLLAVLFKIITGIKIASGAEAAKLLEDQHPWHSLSLLYACFTGFFLFLSGIIAGYVENHIVYGNITERLKTHPILQFTIPAKKLDKVVRTVKDYSGAFAGSISLGFFLGFAGPLGKMTGLPFDIRHITISAGNTAIGFYGLDHQVTLSYMLVILLGVILIGLLNFMVSFSLAFAVAVRSRGIRLRDYPEFIGILWNYFWKFPKDFIRPPVMERLATELL